MSLLPLALTLGLLGTPGGAPQETPSAGALQGATPRARALWERVCQASGAVERPPLTAFQLQAEVRIREGMQRNDLEIDYRYLAPDCIRFRLPTKNETGRFGPAQEQYWLRGADGSVVQLAGREYGTDRSKVDEMLVLARNYVALSNPGRLALVSLELRSGPPPDLGAAHAKTLAGLAWLSVESPDFALVRGESPPAPGTVYHVDLAVRALPEGQENPPPPGLDDLPRAAIVRAVGPHGGQPLLVEFARYEARQDFNIPLDLRVFQLDPAQSPAAFAALAWQEIHVQEASMRPAFTVDDFRPKTP